MPGQVAMGKMMTVPVSKDVQVGLDGIVCSFRGLEDLRGPIHTRDPWASVVMI